MMYLNLCTFLIKMVKIINEAKNNWKGFLVRIIKVKWNVVANYNCIILLLYLNISIGQCLAFQNDQGSELSRLKRNLSKVTVHQTNPRG